MEKHYTCTKTGKYSYNVKADEGYKIQVEKIANSGSTEYVYVDSLICNEKYIDNHLVVVKK